MNTGFAQIISYLSFICENVARVSIEDLGKVDDSGLPVTTEDEAPTELDFAALVRLLVDVVSNPWQAARILEETLTDIRNREVSGASHAREGNREYRARQANSGR